MRLAGSMPDGLHEALTFLDGVIQGDPHSETASEHSSVSYSWRLVVHLLAGSLEQAPAEQRQSSWVEEEKRSRAGYAVFEPELLEFLARFRTPGEITDPLAGLRAKNGQEGCPEVVPWQSSE